MEPDETPTLPVVRVGVMPLVDVAPLVMASVLRLDRRHGVQLRLSREASWAALRDKLLGGALDMAQALYGMVYGVHLGIGGPRAPMALLMGLNRNGQGISISRRLADSGVRDLPSLAAHLRASGGRSVLAQTFPTGTHAMWLYHALAAHGVHPLRDARVQVLPPPLMVDALRDGQADVVSVGAPWNRLGEIEGVAVPLLDSAEVWPEHPEKALAAPAAYADRHPDICRAVVAAVLEACRWLDADPTHRLAAAEILAGERWIGVRADAIADALLGRSGAVPMRFHAEGDVNHPWLSDGMWFMTQHKHWGLLDAHPDYEAVAREVQRTELYREAAATVDVPAPLREMRCSTLLDGRVWDGRDPAAYADGGAYAQRRAAAL